MRTEISGTALCNRWPRIAQTSVDLLVRDYGLVTIAPPPCEAELSYSWWVSVDTEAMDALEASLQLTDGHALQESPAP